MEPIDRPARARVLVALHDELLNGASISVLRIWPLLEARGWRLSFWVPTPGPAFDWLRDRGAEVAGEPRPIVSGLRPLREPPGAVRRLVASPGYLRRFRRHVKGLAPAVVHANSLYSFAEALTARAAGAPTILHVHDMAPASRKAGLARALCRRGVDVTVAVSRACADSYREGDWAPRVVHEATPAPERPVALRKAAKPFVVGTVGVIARRKGSDIFVEAARRVLATTNGIEFRLVGAPTEPLEREWGTEVLREAARVGIVHRDRADVFEELGRWDAFVLASRRDPFPIAMLEAMASGLPVIGARRDGIPEQITPGCGVLVEPDDPEALATAIRELANLPLEQRTAMGAAARERVIERFNLEVQAGGIDRAYRDAIELRAPRRRPLASCGL